jgi:transcription elongation factor GreA
MTSMAERKPVPLTQAAYDRLKEEMEFLEGDARTKIVEEIARARSHGDLSENAEYHAAKDQQGLQEARIRQIRHMLENAEIIQGDADDTVKPGKLVTIRYKDEEEPETYFLGLREERGGEHDVLTPDSPVGRALVGRSAGDKVSASVPAGELVVEIVEVRTP